MGWRTFGRRFGEAEAQIPTEVTADGILRLDGNRARGLQRVVRGLGLGGAMQIPTNPRGLAVLIGLAAARYAVIDVGTNSVKFHIGERSAEGQWRTVVDRAELTRLGEGLAHHHVIGGAALERTTTAITGMVEEAQRQGVLATVAVGTAGLRMASNRNEVIAAIEARTGLHIEVISGEEEGRLAYLAARSGLVLAPGSIVVFDSGGGSTQFTFGHDSSVDERFSLEVGSARYTERYKLEGLVQPDVLRAAMAAIAADLAPIAGRAVPDALVAMGGTVTNMASVKHQLARYDANVVQGAVLDRTEVERQIELYRSRDVDARRAIIGLQPKRAEVILAGACIIRTVMEKLGKETLTVSDRSLRHGVLAERFDG